MDNQPVSNKTSNFSSNQIWWIKEVTSLGGLSIPIFHEKVEIEFINSNKITSELATLIKQQSLQYDTHEDNVVKLKTEIKQSKKENYTNVIERITTKMNCKEKRPVDTSAQIGFSNWLTTI